MKSIARAYSNKRECSVQEAVYQIMPELWLRKCFPAVLFANSNTARKVVLSIQITPGNVQKYSR